MSRHLVAVYGTLRVGQPNNRLLNGCKHLGETVTVANATMYDNGYFPYVVLGDGDGPIVVDVYEVYDDTLHCLDYLEGYRGDSRYNHYERSAVEVVGFEEKALIYHVFKEDVEHLPVIESGNWFVK